MTSISASWSSAPGVDDVDGEQHVPVGRRSVAVVGDELAMRDWAEELVERARSEGVELTGDDGLLTGLVRRCFRPVSRSS